MKKEYNFRDPVVKSVCDKFVSRSDVGYEKYGRTLNEERTMGFKELGGYLNDIQEELMDAILYIQAARDEVRDHLEEFAIHASHHDDDDYDPSNEF